MREKRQHHRASLEVPVSITAKDGSMWITESVDVSIGGMFLSGTSQADIGAEVVLRLGLPKLGDVELPGFIRWTAGNGFGVQFGPIGARETHAIGNIIRDQAVPSSRMKQGA